MIYCFVCLSWSEIEKKTKERWSKNHELPQLAWKFSFYFPSFYSLILYVNINPNFDVYEKKKIHDLPCFQLHYFAVETQGYLIYLQV